MVTFINTLYYIIILLQYIIENIFFSNYLHGRNLDILEVDLI
jgi:hypothetical protein